jgi:hypothetical protein
VVSLHPQLRADSCSVESRPTKLIIGQLPIKLFSSITDRFDSATPRTDLEQTSRCLFVVFDDSPATTLDLLGRQELLQSPYRLTLILKPVFLFRGPLYMSSRPISIPHPARNEYSMSASLTPAILITTSPSPIPSDITQMYVNFSIAFDKNLIVP